MHKLFQGNSFSGQEFHNHEKQKEGHLTTPDDLLFIFHGFVHTPEALK